MELMFVPPAVSVKDQDALRANLLPLEISIDIYNTAPLITEGAVFLFMPAYLSPPLATKSKLQSELEGDCVRRVRVVKSPRQDWRRDGRVE